MKESHYETLSIEGSDDALAKRPLSPHLQIYRWPVSMVLSISHRITGVGLSVGALMMAWWLVAAAFSDAAFTTVQGFLGSAFGIFLLMGWSAALLLHLFLGIRHLMWDAGWGFGPQAQQQPVVLGSESRVYRITGWGVIGITVVATLVVWITGFMVWR